MAPKKPVQRRPASRRQNQSSTAASSLETPPNLQHAQDDLTAFGNEVDPDMVMVPDSDDDDIRPAKRVRLPTKSKIINEIVIVDSYAIGLWNEAFCFCLGGGKLKSHSH